MCPSFDGACCIGLLSHITNHSIALTKVRAFAHLLSYLRLTDAKNEIQIVQASLLGSILANLLLILGMCFLFGGLRFREQVCETLVQLRLQLIILQIYNSAVTQLSACLLSLSVMSLLLPVSHLPKNRPSRALAPALLIFATSRCSSKLIAVGVCRLPSMLHSPITRPPTRRYYKSAEVQVL